jgi:hypothetical protein
MDRNLSAIHVHQWPPVYCLTHLMFAGLRWRQLWQMAFSWAMWLACWMDKPLAGWLGQWVAAFFPVWVVQPIGWLSGLTGWLISTAASMNRLVWLGSPHGYLVGPARWSSSLTGLLCWLHGCLAGLLRWLPWQSGTLAGPVVWLVGLICWLDGKIQECKRHRPTCT